MEETTSERMPPLGGYVQKNLIELIGKALPYMEQFSWLDANVRGVIVFSWWGKRFSIDANLKIFEIDESETYHRTREASILEHCMQQEVTRRAWEETARWKLSERRAELQKLQKIVKSLSSGLDYLDTKFVTEE
jgi:phage terminase Nu1 subunit (DNA packaging protein)